MEADSVLAKECAPGPWPEVIGYEVRAPHAVWDSTRARMQVTCTLATVQQHREGPTVLSRQKEPQLYLAGVGDLRPSSSLNARSFNACGLSVCPVPMPPSPDSILCKHQRPDRRPAHSRTVP